MQLPGGAGCAQDARSVSGQNAFSVNIQEGIETAEIPIQSITLPATFSMACRLLCMPTHTCSVVCVCGGGGGGGCVRACVRAC